MFLRHDSSLILSDLDSAIANGRKIEKVYALRATFRRQNGDADGALADYQTAVGLNPDSAASTVGLVSIYEVNGDDAQATLILENFLSRYESSLKKLPTVKGKVVATSDAVVLKEENMMVTSNSVIISDNSQNGMPSPEQLQKFTEKLENTKNTSLAYSKLASLYEKRGDHEKALETVEKAIKIDPTDANSLGVRGKIKTSMKDYNGAYEDLSTAIKSIPSFPNYYLDRGILLLLMNKDDEAQKDFDKYLTIVPPGNAHTYLDKKIAEAKKLREEVN